jgi:hypothetical protein
MRRRRPVSEVAAYAEHIDMLLETHGIAVDWRDRTAARAWRKSRRVRLERIKGASTYAMALHEIGHIVGPQGTRRLDKEAQAWVWAQETAIEWTDGMARFAARCIESYLVWCDSHRSAWVPPKNHVARKIARGGKR